MVNSILTSFGMIKKSAYPRRISRAITCWKVYRERDESRTSRVVKGSWRYPEPEEDELLREATEKKVVNMARYYHHETVRVSGEDDNVHRRVRTGLDITKATDYKPRGSVISPNKYELHDSTCTIHEEAGAPDRRTAALTPDTMGDRFTRKSLESPS